MSNSILKGVDYPSEFTLVREDCPDVKTYLEIYYDCMKNYNWYTSLPNNAGWAFFKTQDALQKYLKSFEQ